MPVDERDTMAVLSEFSAALAHELRNPLSSIRMNLQIISRSVKEADRDLDPSTGEHCEVALKEVEHLEKILQGVMDFARPSSLKLSEEAMGDIIDATLRMAEKELVEKRIEVVREGAGLPPVLMDAVKMKQALLNIILNSVHAMDAGGRLTLSVSPHGGGATLTIGDDGAGMTPEVLSRMFEPFFTTSPQGTGLGLAITKKIIEQHGGTIEVRSAPGKGTVTSIAFCARSAQEPGATDGASSDARRLKGRTG